MSEIFVSFLILILKPISIFAVSSSHSFSGCSLKCNTRTSTCGGLVSSGIQVSFFFFIFLRVVTTLNVVVVVWFSLHWKYIFFLLTKQENQH